MHLWRLWIVLGLFAAFAGRAAVIYKWTDTDGVIHYSDHSVPGAEKIVTSSSSANGIGGAVRSSGTSTPKSQPASGLDFSQFLIESPAADQVFFGDEIVPVRLHLEPGLNANQWVTWYLNGKPLTDQPPDATAFALQSLPRGSYTVSATVTDSVSGASRSADGVTFNVRQPSELAPQHKKP
jgi:hypothetical protein